MHEIIPPGLGDMNAAVRYLVTRPRDDWRAEMQMLIMRAREGARFHIAHGVPHPKYGSGDVMSASLPLIPKPETAPDRATYWGAAKEAAGAFQAAEEAAGALRALLERQVRVGAK